MVGVGAKTAPVDVGPTVVIELVTVEADREVMNRGFRMPVQGVNRADRTFRGFPGTVVAGQVKKGDEVRVLPSGEQAAITDIVLYKDSLDKAITDQSITLTLDRDVDCSRGDLIVTPKAPCEVADQF